MVSRNNTLAFIFLSFFADTAAHHHHHGGTNLKDKVSTKLFSIIGMFCLSSKLRVFFTA
jgi:hypothetical protein